MAFRSCPACRHVFEVKAHQPGNVCPVCGAAVPPQHAGGGAKPLNLLRIARLQRRLLIVFVAALGTAAIGFVGMTTANDYGYPALSAVALGILLLSLPLNVWLLVVTIQLGIAVQLDALYWVLLVVLLFSCGCGGLIMMLVIVGRANQILKARGIPVGLLGASPNVVKRFVAENLCLECGYDLRGTPSDRCPECGAYREDRAPGGWEVR